MKKELNHKGSVVLHGPRIVLQPFKGSDAFFMFRNWANDPDVTRYMTWFAHKNIQETESVIALWEKNYSKPNFYQWAILLRKIDEPIVQHLRKKEGCFLKKRQMFYDIVV